MRVVEYTRWEPLAFTRPKFKGDAAVAAGSAAELPGALAAAAPLVSTSSGAPLSARPFDELADVTSDSDCALPSVLTVHKPARIAE